MEEFKNQTLKELKWWAWAATVLPIGALAFVFFAWLYGLDNWINIAMVVGSASMFVIAVVWWWWVIKVVKCLIDMWTETGQNLQDVSTTVKEIRSLVQEAVSSDNDK